MIPFTDPTENQRSDEIGVELSDYLFIVFNRWPLLLLGFLIAGILGTVAYLNQVPIYAAECLVMAVDPNASQKLEFDYHAHFSNQDLSWKTRFVVEKMVVIANSRPNIQEVVRRLQLHKRSPFKSPLSVIIADFKSRWGIKSSVPPKVALNEDALINAAAGQVSASLSAETIADSQLLRISYVDADQENIHKILNEVVKVLDDATVAFKRKQFREGQASLNERLREIKTRLQESERQLKIFKRDNNAVQIDTQVDRITQLLAKDVDPKTAEAEMRLAENESRERDGRATPEDVRSGLDLKGRVQFLHKAKAEYIERIKHLIDVKSELELLERSEQTWRRLHETFDLKIKESQLNELLVGNDIAVMEAAQRPGAPISPSVPKFLVLILGSGFAIGLALVMIADHRDPSLKRVDEIRRLAGTPILSFLPKERRRVGSATPLARVTFDEPRNPLAEAFRTLQASIRVDNLFDLGGPRSTRLCFVTSPGPGDGKSTTSVNLAICMAQSGLKTLLVEADLRRPTISQVFNSPNTLGLSNLDLAQPEHALNRSLMAGLDLLPSGPSIDTPAEHLSSLLNRREFVQFLEGYDRVVFDAPPASIADTLVIARFAKRAIFVISCDKLTRVSLRSTLRQITAAGAQPIGIFANFVAPNAIESKGAYGLYTKYYSRRTDPS